MFKEFKEFAVKGNVVDMAVGIIIGGAFGTIVKSSRRRRHHAAHRSAPRRRGLRQSLPRPEGRRRRATYLSLAEAQEAGAVTLNYGLFIELRHQFSHRRLRGLPRHQADQPAQDGRGSSRRRSRPTKECPHCLSTIPDQGHRAARTAPRRSMAEQNRGRSLPVEHALPCGEKVLSLAGIVLPAGAAPPAEMSPGQGGAALAAEIGSVMEIPAEDLSPDEEDYVG